MDSKKTSNPKTKGRGKFYLLVLTAIAMSALVGACACEDSPALELTYPPIVGTIHSEIGETAPAWSSNLGETVEYKIEPALPEGLSLASDTGIISGTPRTVITQEYTITATLASGTVKETTISITIEDTSEGAFFTYEPIVGAVGGEITPGTPQWARSLSEEIIYTIDFSDPPLPAGLTLDPATGTISGTPEAIWKGDHTVTAAYGGKEKTGVVTITILSKNTFPGPPTALTAVTGDETAQVGWTAPVNTGLVDNAAGAIRGYKVYWDEVAAPTKASSFLLIGDSAAVSAEVAGLTNGRIYYFAAAAFNQLGEGELSEAIAAPTSKPGKLAVPSAVPSGQAITVSWLPPLSETVGPMEALTGYKVYYRETASGGDEFVQEVGPETTSVTFEGLADGTYSFRVTAMCGRGENIGESESSDSKEILLSQTSPPDNAVPGQPWNVKAKAGNGEITVTWSAPADTGIVNGQKADITSFTVYYDVGTGINDITQSSFYSLEFPDTSAKPILTIGALGNGTAYVIAVTASNDEGEGSLSAPVTSQPREENRPPTAPAITDAVAGDGEVKLIWSPPADFGMIDGKAGSLIAYGVYFAKGEAPTESSDVRMVFNVNDTSLVIDELENGTPYQFALRAYTTAGESGLSEPREADPTEADRVPGAPGQPSAVFDTGEVRVSWSAPDDVGIVNGEAGKITGYNIHYSQDADDIRNGAVEEVRPTGEEVPLTWTFALADGGSYYFAAAAVTGAGAGELSAAVQTDRAPGKPSKPQALPGDGTIRVRWYAPADSGIVGGAEGEITGYKIYYREEGAVGEPASMDSGAADREAVLDLTNGLTYLVSVAAVNGAGEGERSDEKEAEPTAGSLADRAPDEPWDVRVIEGDEALTVTWKDPADSGIFQGQEAVITKFEVYYTEGALDPDALTPEEVDLAANPDAERRVELTGLTNGTPYKVAVRTVTSAGTSPLSAIEGTPQIPDQVPGIPSITLTEAEHEKVRIRWSAPDTPGFVNGREAAITGYKIYYERGVEPAKTSSFAEIEDGAALEGAVTNLVNGRTYHFAVSALNGAGEGELSEPKTAQPYRAANRPPGKPDAPVLIPKNTQIEVYWSLPDDEGIVDGYEGVIKKVRIYYAEGSEPAKTSPYVEVDVSDGTSEGLITNLKNMTSYSIGVTAINDEGEGELSDSTTGIPTPYHMNQVPAAPTDVQVSAGDGKLTVSWKEALDTGSYNNQKGTIQNFRVYYGVGSIDVSTAAYETKAYSDPPEDPWTLTIDGLTNGDTYNLAVTAFNEEGESLPSAEVQGMPLADRVPGAPRQELAPLPTTTEKEAEVSWQAPDDKGRKDGVTAKITGYKVYYRLMSDGTLTKDNGTPVDVDDPTKRRAVISGLTNGVEYQFAVTAVNAVGEGELSATQTLTLLPDRTVSFDAKEGSSVSAQTVTYGSVLTEPAPAPTLTGHALEGWYTQDGSPGGQQWGDKWVFTKGVDTAAKSITLYAKWEIQSYKVTYNSHQGSAVDAEDVIFDTLVTEPGAPSKTNLDFVGWYQEDTLTNLWDFANDRMEAQDMTLHAKWEAQVTFEFENGKAAVKQKVAEGAATAKPEDPTKPGYTFAKWYTDPQGTAPWNFVDPLTGHTTLYAGWTAEDYTATFVPNNGKSDITEDFGYETLLTAPTPAPVRMGHALAGWFKQDGSSNGQWGVKWDFAVDKMALGGVTLYAKWDIQSYQVTYNSHHGSAVDAEGVDFGTLVTEPGAPSKPDLDFVGWYREDTLTTPWDFDSDKMEAGNMTLHAKWAAQVTFEFENGDTAVTQSVDEGTAAAKPGAPTKTGYTFAEWYTDRQGTAPWNFADPLTGHTTLYAGWTAEDYTAAFVPNNGESDITEDFGYETLLTAPTPAPVRMGHALAGWFKQDGSSNGQWGVKWDFAVDKMALGGVTLYAQWDIQSYQVTFESHGGSGVAAQTITYDSLVTAPTSDPTRGGYTFAGWYGEDGENNGGNWGTPWDFTQDKVAAQAMTLYARWYSPPSAPGNLVVSSYDDDSVTLSWDGSNNPGSSGGADATISDYMVYYSTTAPVDTSSASSVSSIAATGVTVSGLINNTPYNFVVLAVNSVGLESAPSNEVTQTTDLSDAEKVDADKGDLDIRSAVGGNLQAVKADFTLPVTGGRGTAISWAVTSGTAIVLSGTNGETAAVTRPSALSSDAQVMLRAAITLGNERDTENFTLTVKKAENLTAQESVDKDKTALTVNSFQFAQGDTYGQVTQDFTLPTTGGEGSAISWTLTSGTAISLSGTRNETAAVTRPNNVDGSAAVELKATITKGSVSDTKTFSLTVYRKDRVDIANLGSAVFSLTVADTSVRVLTGRNHTAAVTGSLTAGTDYDLRIEGTGVDSGTVRISNSGYITITSGIALTDAGNYTVKAVGQGNYRNEKTATFTLTVNKRGLGSFVHSFSVGDKDITALTGGTHRVTVGGSLMAGTDYDLRIEGTGVDSGTVRISNSGYITITSAIALSDAGEYTVMAIGKNNYSGTVSDDFFLTVTAKSLTAAGLTLSIGNTAVTALTAKTFDVTVGGGLTKGTDYDLSITGPGATSGAVSIDNDGTITISSDIVVDNAGDYTVTATGTGNYTDTVSDSFTLTVNRKDISSIQSFNVSASSKAATSRTDETYRGGTMGGSLEFGTDYGLAITTKAGGAANFISVDSVDSSSGAITFTITNGIALNDAGTYTLRAAGMAGSNYTGSVSDDFELTVNPKSLSDLDDAVFDVSVGDKTVTALTGDSHTAAITNTGTPSLGVNTDYSLTITAPAGVTPNHLSIDDNGTITIDPAIEVTHAGTYTLKANGLGEYTGSKSDTFFLTVTEKSLTAAGLTLSVGNTAVTALTEATHTATVGGGLRAGIDYGLTITGPSAASGAVSIDNGGTITIDSAIKVTHGGTYTVTAAGKNNYSGTVSDTFTLTVNRKDITTIQSFSVLASDKTATSRTSETYQGGTMGGGLKYGTDYSLAITAKAGGAANFFSVNSVVDSSGAVMFSITNGIVLNDAGTYTLRAAGMAGSNYTGSVSDDFVLTVNQKSLSDLDDAVFGVSAGDKDVTALTEDSHTTTITNTGSPSLVFNTDYSLTITAPAGVTPNHLSIADDGTITIDSAIEVTHGGTYTLTANGLGEYTGSKSGTFTLGVSPKSLTDAGFALSVDAIAATAGTGGSYPAVSAPGFTGGTDYSLAIAAPPGVTNHLSITNDGTITIDPAIEVTHGGTYTVTATGINNYSDTDSAAFTLTVYLPALEGITYADGDFTLDVDIGFGIWPTGENNNQNLVTYAMKPGESLPEGLILDSTWGKISGTPTEGVPRTAYTIVVTGREGTNYAGGQNEAIIMISVDNAVDTFFDFNLSAAEVDAQKNGADLGQVINITRNDRNFIEDTEYRWAITKKSDGTAPGFMRVTNNKLWIIGADIPGSSAAGTYELTAAGHGRYSGEITKEFELKLPADSPPSGAPDITGIAPRDGALAVSWTAPADRGYYDGGKGVITEYTVYWDTASGLTASTAANSQTVLPANNSFEIASLTNGQTYYFIITAATAVGEGPASSAVSGTPSSGYTPPGAPNIVSAIPGSTQVEVGWTAPTDNGIVGGQEGVPSYRIYYSRTPDFGLGQADGYREAANSARSLVVDQLTNLVKYYFRVTAYTGSGESSASTGVLSATPGAVALDANGGSGEPAEAMLSLLTGKIPDYSYGNLERSGYAFAGWNTAADGFGDTYRSGENYSFTEVTTLYAYWLEATEELEYTLIKNDTEYSVKYGEVDQAGADAVTSVIIPAYWQEKPVTEIGDNAFYRPSIVFNNLDSVTMAEGLTKIGASAFREAPLEAVTSLPSSVAEIGDYAFQKSKIALDIFYYQEHSSYKIGANSFEDVKTLTATTLPSDFEISEYAFRNTLLHFNSLPNVVYEGHGGFENAQFSNPDIVTSIKKYSLFSTFKGSNITSIDITMKTLFANFTDTFRDCASLKTVTLRFDDNTPGSPAIPTYSDALLGCPSLEAIYVPSSYVNAYKTADGWSSFASIIKAIPGS